MSTLFFKHAEMNWHRAKPVYARVSSSSSDSGDEEKVLTGSDGGRCSELGEYQALNIWKSQLPWMISTVLLAISTTFLILYILWATPSDSFERGFNTDFAGIRSTIGTTKVRFTGSPSFAEDGEEYVKPVAGLRQYVGTPNAQIDANWEELTHKRYFLLTAEEAEEAWGPSYKDFWDEARGGYLAGLDMFHTLHCLDHLRQAFYPDVYPQTPIHGTMHRDHCIDHLRQMIMCYADVTPIPTRFYPGIAQNYIDSDQMHTCRDFGAIRKWTTERFDESELIAEHH